jgi:hypothetical protein
MVTPMANTFKNSKTQIMQSINDNQQPIFIDSSIIINAPSRNLNNNDAFNPNYNLSRLTIATGQGLVNNHLPTNGISVQS